MTGTKIVGNEYVKVIDHGFLPVKKKKHSCKLPGRRQRKKLGLELLAIIECYTCKQQWQWVYRQHFDGFGAYFEWEWEKIWIQ